MGDKALTPEREAEIRSVRTMLWHPKGDVYEEMIKNLLAEIDRLREERKTLYRRVNAPLEGIPVQFVGCYVTKWGTLNDPTVAFVEVDDELDASIDAAITSRGSNAS